MYDFISFLGKRDEDLYYHHLEVVLERTAVEVESNPPKDGRWENDSAFSFNVEGDDCGYGTRENCYNVTFSGDNNLTIISFSRAGKFRDNRGGFGQKVFDGVFYAVWEYIKKNQPKNISWNPILKTDVNPVTGKMHNPKAREKAYDIFSIKFLFPDYYVSTKLNIWISRSTYDKDYVPQGYPAIPQDVTINSNPNEKKKLLDLIRSKNKEEKDIQLTTSISSSGSGNIESQLRLDHADEESERLIEREFGLKVGDRVLPKISEENYGRQSRYRLLYQIFENAILGLDRELKNLSRNGLIVGKITKLYKILGNGSYVRPLVGYAADVQFVGSQLVFKFFIKDLAPYSDQEAQKITQMANNPVEAMLSDDQYNPYRHKVGQKVVHSYGYIGTISRIYFRDSQNPRAGLSMEVRWNPQESLPGSQNPMTTAFELNSHSVAPADERNIEYAKTNIQSLMANQRAQAEREQAARSRRPDHLDPEYMDSILQHHD